MMDISEVIKNIKEDMVDWSDEMLMEHINKYERLKAIFEVKSIRDEYTLERITMVLALLKLETTKRKTALK